MLTSLALYTGCDDGGAGGEPVGGEPVGGEPVGGEGGHMGGAGGEPECTPSDEVCDGEDNDCDGVIDEGTPGVGDECDTGLAGVCRTGALACEAGEQICVQSVESSDEVCDGLDNDCDGLEDEDDQGEPLTRLCYQGPEGTEGVGPCVRGSQTCRDDGTGFGPCATICDPDSGEVICDAVPGEPSPEICDNIDNDCNELVDDLPEEGVCAEHPVNLEDGGGFNWDVRNRGHILNGSSDAYDGALRLYIDDEEFPARRSRVVEDRTVVFGPRPMSGLEVTRRVFVPEDDNYARWLEILENPGDADVEITLSIRGNLGSDGGAVLVAESSGDQQLDPADDYMVTDDASDGGFDPSMAHVFSNETGRLEPALVTLSRDSFRCDFVVRVPAGGRAAVMHFASQNPDRATATTQAQALRLLGGTLTESLPEGLDIVNFGPIFCDNIRVGVLGGGFYHDELRAYLDEQPNITAERFDACDAATLSQFDSIIVHGNTPCFDSEAFDAFVAAGGGLIGVPWVVGNRGEGIPASLPVEGERQGRAALGTVSVNVLTPDAPLDAGGELRSRRWAV